MVFDADRHLSGPLRSLHSDGGTFGAEFERIVNQVVEYLLDFSVLRVHSKCLGSKKKFNGQFS